jgi:hypothetical protein
VQIANRLGKFPLARRTLFCRRCNFSRLFAANSQAGQAKIMILLMISLWRTSLMLVFNRSLLNREYILINVLKALALTISMRNLHETFLSKTAPRYFILFTNGMYQCKTGGIIYIHNYTIRLYLLCNVSTYFYNRLISGCVDLLPWIPSLLSLCMAVNDSYQWLHNKCVVVATWFNVGGSHMCTVCCTSPLSVQNLQSSSCVSYLFYATTAA